MGALNKKKVHPYSKVDKRSARVNGWSAPLHHFQFLAFLFFFLFAASYFGLMIPMLPKSSLKWLALISNGVIFLFHFIIYIINISIDPADQNVINKYKQSKIRIGSTFNRAEHRHVIENQFCYICEVNVGPKSKHCSVCNKCVSNFDHHCKWFNNCVGGKNYRLFITCVVTAVLGISIIFSLSVTMTNAFFTEDSWLNGSHFDHLSFVKSTNSFILDKVSINYKSLWIIIIVITLVTSFLAFILLFHLLCFHIFLYIIGLSTYEFMVQRRQKDEVSSNKETTFNRLKKIFFSNHFKICAKPFKKFERLKGSSLNNEHRFDSKSIINISNNFDSSVENNHPLTFQVKNKSNSSLDFEENNLEKTSKSKYIEGFINKFKSNQLIDINLNRVEESIGLIDPIFIPLSNNQVKHLSLDHLNYLNVDIPNASLKSNNRVYNLKNSNKKKSQTV